MKILSALLLTSLIVLSSPSGAQQPPSRTCQFNAGPRAGQRQSYPQAQPIPVGSPCQDGQGSTGLAIAEQGPNPIPGGGSGQLTRTCQFNAGPRTGQRQSYPQAQPIPVGSPCQDGQGSTGLTVAEQGPPPVPGGGSGQLTRTCQFNAGPRAGQRQSYPQAQPIPVGSPCQDGQGSTGLTVAEQGPPPIPGGGSGQLTRTCQFNAGPRAGQTQSYPEAQPIPVGSPCQDGQGSTGLAIAEQGPTPIPGGGSGQLTRTCQFNAGPRAGQTQSYPEAQPIPVGSPCQDGQGSTGLAIAEQGPTPIPGGGSGQLTRTCQFSTGPRAGQTQTYPQAQPIPVGSPCQDGQGSTGTAVPDKQLTSATQTATCPAGFSCAFIPATQLPQIKPQLTMVWCWVASAQAIFQYYGHDVDQATIVSQVLGQPIVTAANAQMMVSMLNRQYVDKQGVPFAVRTPLLWDSFSWLSANPAFMANIGAQPLNNRGVRDAIAAGRPLLIGTKNHAMVLVGMIYSDVNGNIIPRAGYVLDPAPTAFGGAVGLRQLSAGEMTAYFAADVTVQ